MYDSLEEFFARAVLEGLSFDPPREGILYDSLAVGSDPDATAMPTRWQKTMGKCGGFATDATVSKKQGPNLLEVGSNNNN